VADDLLKRCEQCDRTLPLSGFLRVGPRGLDGICHRCRYNREAHRPRRRSAPVRARPEATCAPPESPREPELRTGATHAEIAGRLRRLAADRAARIAGGSTRRLSWDEFERILDDAKDDGSMTDGR
jgi:hypothetical protein